VRPLRVPLIGDKAPFGPEDRANKAAGITTAGRSDEMPDDAPRRAATRRDTKSPSLLTR